ncbi:MAG: hypothetical protein L7U25_00470 [Candidatus Poseidonia sp.]|nr:hypothetical protein [Poseidonia sp.]
MRTVVALALIALVAFSSTSYAAKNAGQDNGPDVGETPFESYTVTTPSVSGETWTLVVVMDEAHTSNNTTFEITSQICLNDGVCDPPVVQDVTVDGATHTTSLTPPNDHSYVNWRVKAMYEDDSTEYFPYGSCYTIWSSCYYDDGSYYGPDADGDGCAGEEEDAPGFTLLPALAAIGLAIAIARRN